MNEVKAELNAQDVWRMFEETNRRFQETDRKFRETDQKLRETDQKLRETDQKLRELGELFTGQWGKLMEALIRPGLLDLFQQRGIDVTETLQRDRVRRGGREMEVDVMLIDGDVVIPVEVKTTLKIQDVRDYLERLKDFPLFFPKYQGCRIYGAMAAVQIEEQADRFAYRKGLFVLGLGRNGLIRILNDDKFQPVDMGSLAPETPAN